jgi:hypothetical protein
MTRIRRARGGDIVHLPGAADTIGERVILMIRIQVHVFKSDKFADQFQGPGRGPKNRTMTRTQASLGQPRFSSINAPWLAARISVGTLATSTI